MNDDLRHYARIGLAHFMFYPDCVRRERVIVETLPAMLRRGDIEVVDFCLPFEPRQRAQLSALLRACDKRLRYAIHPWPADKISLGSTWDNEQALLRMLLEDQLEAAAGCGADSFTFLSGIDLGDAERPAAMAAFTNLCRWLCPRAEEYGMTTLVEPFDRDFHRRFLVGPTAECAALVESLRPVVTNLRIQLDMAHVRLSGETFEHAVAAAGSHLGHVHLGNCVMGNRDDPFFGDRHPPFGYPGGEIDVPELTVILRALLNAGYLNKQSRGTLVIETQPVPGDDVEQLARQGLAKLEAAWRAV